MQLSMIRNSEVSQYRKRIGEIIRHIQRLSSRCLFDDPLIQGSPASVFRKCGRPACKCATDPDARHGPYKVIQVVRNKRSRQICLRKSQDKLWLLAKNYQHQNEKYLELKQQCNELLRLVCEVIDKRCIEFPESKDARETPMSDDK